MLLLLTKGSGKCPNSRALYERRIAVPYERELREANSPSGVAQCDKFASR